MNRFIIALLGSAALIACSPSTSDKPGKPVAEAPSAEAVAAETARLNTWFEERYEEELAFSPITQTFLGRKTNYDKIDDLSEEAEDAQLAWRRGTVKDLKANFDYDKLTADAKISYDLWVYTLDREERGVPFRRQNYILHQFNGAQSFLPSFLINTQKVDNAEDMSAYISRVKETGRALNQLLDAAKTNAAAGTRPPRFSYEGVLDQSKKITTGAPFDDGEPSALYADMLGKILMLEKEAKIDNVQAEALRAETKTALTDALKPAYDRIITWFEADLDNVDETPRGVGALENGEAYYNHMLWVSTTTDLTADEIHQIGLDEVARIRGEMEDIKNQVGFDGTLAEFFTFVKEDDQFYFSNDDKGAQDYIDAAAGHIKALEAKLPDYFGILPKAELEVRRVEPFREQPGAAQHYRAGTPDGSRPGIYYAHLSDMRAMSIPSLEVIAYHEGLPGHHMQISIQQELEGVPTFRTQSRFTAYSEGWGLYSELLAKEMGSYENSYSDFGRLTTEIWRAIRLVVDTGLHSKGWTEEQARQYFYDNSPIPEGAVKSEVRRYLVWPGQATSYKIGMLKILEIRKKAEDELGDKFDIRGFHDTILGGGAVPLHIMEKRVDQWIEKTKG